MKITIYVGQCWENFGPLTTDIGGSEKAVIAMARELSIAGAEVLVVGGVTAPATGPMGDQWIPHQGWVPTEQGDLFVAWRVPNGVIQARPHYKKVAVWLHDMTYTSWPKEVFEYIDCVLCLSEFHTQNFLKYNPRYTNKMFQTANGIDVVNYPAIKPVKREHHYIYSSSPRRGLGTLLKEWPDVRKKFPDAVLNVAYGFDLSIKMSEAAGDTFQANVYRKLQKQTLNTEGVVYHGRLTQEKLAALQRDSYAWLYPPNDFEETFCITALEVQAAYCMPISRANGALPEVLQEYIQWDYGVSTVEILDFAQNSVIMAVGNYDRMLSENRRWVEHYTWTRVAEQWLELLCS